MGGAPAVIILGSITLVGMGGHISSCVLANWGRTVPSSQSRSAASKPRFRMAWLSTPSATRVTIGDR